MSQDFQIGFPCPHLTVEERVVLDADRKSLFTRQPVASLPSVRISANDELYIPQQGLAAPATLSSGVSGPFNILQNANSFTIRNSVLIVPDILLPTGPRVAAGVVVSTIDKAVKNAGADILVENVGGYIFFTDLAKVGTSSRLEVSGTAREATGFGNQRGASGRILFPGWTLANRVDSIPNRYPKFISQVRSNPVFKVTYTTYVERCLRCQGTFVENDTRLNELGDEILIGNEDLLYQASLKILLTLKGSNKYEPWYGTRLLDRVGTKLLGGIVSSLQEDVVRALRNIQELQKAQSRYQQVTARERLYEILSINVINDPDDPTVIRVPIIVQNAAQQPIELNIVFTVPGAIALAGSNNLSLGV